jgi:enterochelin esterase-like enzyme
MGHVVLGVTRTGGASKPRPYGENSKAAEHLNGDPVLPQGDSDCRQRVMLGAMNRGRLMKNFSAFAAALLVFCTAVIAWPRNARVAVRAGANDSKCAPFDQMVARVAAVADTRAKSKIVDDIIACVPAGGAPLMEKGSKEGFGRAIFLYRGPASFVALAGDMNSWTPSEAFTAVSGTNLFFLSREYEMDARLDYKFVLNDKDWIFDPMNPRRLEGGVGANSFFAMPGYVPPPEFEPGPSLRHGAIQSFSFASRILGNERSVKIYLPWGYGESRERYRTLYVLDGTDYLNLGKINEIVDAMIDSREIPPVIMVLVPALDRNKEYFGNADFARAFATELVPAIDAKFRTKADAGSRAVLGSSLGGLMALQLAGQTPQVFANCAGQSSAIFADTDLDKLVTAPKDALRFHLDVGTYETSIFKANLLEGNRRLRDSLQSRGYALEYTEVHEGHSWGSWPARIPEALRFFWAIPKKKK